MKKVLPAVATVLVLCGSVFAARMQATGVRVGPTDDMEDSSTPKSDRKKIAAQPVSKGDPKDGKNEKKSESQKPSTISAPSPLGTNGASMMADTPSKSNVAPSPGRELSIGTAGAKPTEAGTASGTKAAAGETTGAKTETLVSATSTAPLTNIYRVGTGDVLDIRLLNLQIGRAHV